MTIEKFRRDYFRYQRLAMLALVGCEKIGGRLVRLGWRFLTMRERYVAIWRTLQQSWTVEERHAAEEIDRKLQAEEFARAARDLTREAAEEMRREETN